MAKVIRYIFCVWVVLLIVGFILFINKNRLQEDKELENGISTNETDEYINYGYEYGYYTPEYIEKKFGVKNLTNEEYELMLYYDKHIYEMLLKMTEKGNSWRCFPILKSIKDRYNEKEGILEKYEFDNVEYSQETLDLIAENGSTSPICFIVTKGKKKTKIYFKILMDGGLDELEEEKVIDITDVNGNELDTRMVCNEKNWEEFIWLLFYLGKDYYKTIAVTKNFEDNYDSLETAISSKLSIHKSGYSIGINSNDFNKKIVNYYWKSNNIKYIVTTKIILDNNKYLDNIDVIDINKY